jgi:hypothetical protein
VLLWLDERPPRWRDIGEEAEDGGESTRGEGWEKQVNSFQLDCSRGSYGKFDFGIDDHGVLWRKELDIDKVEEMIILIRCGGVEGHRKVCYTWYWLSTTKFINSTSSNCIKPRAIYVLFRCGKVLTAFNLHAIVNGDGVIHLSDLTIQVLLSSFFTFSGLIVSKRV